MSDPTKSRGYRNMNPGNLNYIADPTRAFEGQIGLGDEWLQAGRRFARYATHELGIRALVAQLTVNQVRYGCNTIKKQIMRWAPSSDNNDTPAYIQAVSEKVGIAADAPLDMKRYSHAEPLVRAIITHELGGMPYSPEQIDRGLALYGLVPHTERTVSTLIEAAQTNTGRAAATVATATTVAASAAGVIQSLGALPQWTSIAMVAAAAVVAVVYLLQRRRDA